MSDEVIYVDDEASDSFLGGAEFRGHFWPLCRFFVSEDLLTYCGIASAVTVLNSLGVSAPDSPQIYPFRMFTQENFFSDRVLRVRRPSAVEKNGNTLDQLAEMLSVSGVDVTVHRADDLTVDEARRILTTAMQSDNQRIIVDFHRKALGQKGGGHFSPLAAYNSTVDRFLLLDVARYKLPPCWVPTDSLHTAMTDIDPVSGRSRGFIVIERAGPTG